MRSWLIRCAAVVIRNRYENKCVRRRVELHAPFLVAWLPVDALSRPQSSAARPLRTFRARPAQCYIGQKALKLNRVLLISQDSCPGGVHMVYIVTKKNSPLIMFNSSKVKEQVNFEVGLLASETRGRLFVLVEVCGWCGRA